MADFHSNQLLFVCARKFRRDIELTSVRYITLFHKFSTRSRLCSLQLQANRYSVEATVIVNIAEAVNILDVRFRECRLVEPKQHTMSSELLPQLMKMDALKTYMESINAPQDLEVVLRQMTLECSSGNLLTLNDYVNG